MTSVASSTSSSTSAATSAATTASAAKTSTSSNSTSKYASTSATSVDWTGLIEAAYEDKLSSEDSYKTKVSTNETKLSAYAEGQSLLSTLKDAANALRAPSSALDQTKDVFNSRSATLTASGSVDTSSTVAVTASSGAATGTHSLTISQLAQSQKVASSSYTSSTTDLSLSGSVTLGSSTGKTANIAITTSMSLADIAGAINDQTSTTGVQASILKVSDSSSELVLSTSDTGATMSVTDTDGIFKSLGLVGSDGSFSNVLQTSQDAKFAVDGVSMTRSSNDVTDAIDGVTMNLYATTGTNASVTIKVAQDTSKIETAINTFTTAYNSYRDWALTQQQTGSDGTASSDSPLFGDSTVANINSNLMTGLNFSVDDTSLASLGITYDSSNKLVVDSTTLESALSSDADKVQSLFTYQLGATSSDLRQLGRGTDAPASFTLDFSTDSSGSLTGVSVGGDDTLFTIDGSVVNGKKGTAYEGYSFVFTGTSSESITVNQTYGIGEQLYNLTDAAANTTSGSLQTLQDELKTQDSDYQTQITNIESRAQTYKDGLTSRYAKIQGSISTASSTLDYLTALLDQKKSS
ncbi:MAG: flagellar filament capping protein FliD [Ancalomicrobiaceae bacterium]|nr:flagellar filament capping protein FliD [Ancalomicrobiaceae bacterium]